MSDGEGSSKEIDPRGEAPAAGQEPETEREREIDLWMYELMARLAHDMRAPLSAIRIWSQMLRGANDADRTAALDAIDASTRWQSDMIAFLNDAAQIVVGRLPVEQRPCDMRSIVRAGVEACAREARDRDVAVDLKLAADDEALVVIGDDRRLRQAAGCLVGAAIGRAPSGGKVTVRLVADRGTGSALVEIRTAATGLDERDVRDLFTPYRPGKNSLGRPLRDFGLGLPFSRHLFRELGGDIQARLDAAASDASALVLAARLPLDHASP